jgi:hypothetical protein
MDTRRQGRRPDTPSPYAMRHTYAAFSIAAEVALFTLARR